MTRSDDDVQNAETPTFILVHGTFARGAPWTQPGSAIWTTLSSAFPNAQIRRFDWSGKNSHHARRHASEALSSLILSMDISQGPIYIIAHSHGGNVALQAISSRCVQYRVNGLVCLATPFIVAEARILRDLFRPLSITLPVVVTYLAFVTAVSAAIVAVTTVFEWLRPSQNVVIVALAAFMILAIGGTVGLFKLIRNRVDTWHQAALLRQKRLYAVLSHDEIDVPVVAVFVARDEAAIVLKTGFLLGDVPQRLWTIIIQFMKVSLLIVAASFIAGVIAGKDYEDAVFMPLTVDLTIYLLAIPAAISVFCTLLMAAFPFLIRGVLVFGGEGLLDNLLLRISASTMPAPAVKHAFALPVALGLGLRIRHSAIYLDNRFLERLPTIIRRLGDGLSPLPDANRRKPTRPRLGWTAPLIVLGLLAWLALARGEYYLEKLAAVAGPSDWRDRYPQMTEKRVSEKAVLTDGALSPRGVNRLLIIPPYHCALVGSLRTQGFSTLRLHKLHFAAGRVHSGPDLVVSSGRRHGVVDVLLEPGVYHFHLLSDRKPDQISSRINRVCWTTKPRHQWSWRDWLGLR